MGRIYWNIKHVKNIVTLFARQTITVTCSYRRQILHIWSGSGGRRKLITICGKFAGICVYRYVCDKLASGIWKNLLRKTVVPRYNYFQVGRFLPEGRKTHFFSMVKTGLAKILFAGKNSIFLPAKIGLCQNCHQSKLEPWGFFYSFFLMPSGS